ncbi:MAG TPA: flagellar motor stator protein MotA [candidate division Zixibacteria bacterium]|nr:flagellar motor stator protein MotA [candidate division Zixibacteria bacterium]MDD4916608.1 flagellar motor stator protein MotA [candidate division Zixibacteria bacterium]MDM7973560.1 flagellar motor stator protein MotA [candidate division Zixibacteria bacterium]HOD65499.1 flagellar motor stator protein MotA [candidate division Zixibacteria bacterium]HPM37848.1 flagellar motor stator protein MotA [candidate division Zixibacteria bacterium]
MFIFIGALIVLGGVLGGYTIHGGKILALNQPSELLIIGGAALGSLLISTPLPVVRGIFAQLKQALGGGLKKKDYLSLLVMMFEIFNVARKDGLIGLESHVEHPEESEIFKRYPGFLKNHHAVAFFTDTMRVIISGAVQPHDLEDLMDADIETLHEEELRPSTALGAIADALPGLGIVAAVLGVVITMAAIDGPPEVIGHKVAAALVGTFLGILSAYGFVGPLSSSLKHRTNDMRQYLGCMKHALLSFHKGVAGVIAVEFARRSLYAEVRPAFLELEKACNETKKR